MPKSYFVELVRLQDKLEVPLQYQSKDFKLCSDLCFIAMWVKDKPLKMYY